MVLRRVILPPTLPLPPPTRYVEEGFRDSCLSSSMVLPIVVSCFFESLLRALPLMADGGIAPLTLYLLAGVLRFPLSLVSPT